MYCFGFEVKTKQIVTGVKFSPLSLQNADLDTVFDLKQHFTNFWKKILMITSIPVTICILVTHLRAMKHHSHTESVSHTCHPKQVNVPHLKPSQKGQYSIYLPRRDGRL